MKYKVKQRGDTIIEVLLAMSVIGLVLGASFGIANRSVRIGQNAQERTEALKIAESQLEIFKSEYFTNLDIQGRNDTRPFCLVTGGSSVVVVDNTESDCKDIDGNGQSGLYSVSIYPPNSDPLVDKTGAYEIKVTWTRLGVVPSEDDDDSISRLSLYYKVGNL